MAKLTLKPIEAQLKKIRPELEGQTKVSTGTTKKTLQDELKKLNRLIKLVPETCKRHTLGV